MTQKVTSKLFIIISILVLLAALPAVVLAQEGEEAMEATRLHRPA
jgi:hypothetical protein